MKAQAGMEYMLLFGLSLMVVGVLWYVSNNNIENTQWDLQLSYAKNALSKITGTADVVYIEGEPTQSYINVYLPENVNAIYIANNSVTIEMRWREFLRNVTDYSVANLTGSITPVIGRNVVLIKAGTKVNVSGV